MTLIDGERAEELYGLMGPAVEISGGSAANTIVGVAALGGRSEYLGKVRDDQLGNVFAHDIRVMFATEAIPTQVASYEVVERGGLVAACSRTVLARGLPTDRAGVDYASQHALARTVALCDRFVSW